MNTAAAAYAERHVTPREIVALEMLASGVRPALRDLELARRAVTKLRAFDSARRQPRLLVFHRKPGPPSEAPRVLRFIRANRDVYTLEQAAARLGLCPSAVSRIVCRSGNPAAIRRLLRWRRRHDGRDRSGAPK